MKNLFNLYEVTKAVLIPLTTIVKALRASEKCFYINFSLFCRLKRAASNASIVQVMSVILLLRTIIAQVVSLTS